MSEEKYNMDVTSMSNREKIDHILLKRSYQGDKKAIDKLFKFYYGFAITHCMKMGCDRYSSEEVVQNTFLKIFLKITKGREDEIGSFRPYLAQSLRFNVKEYYRNNKNKKTLMIDDETLQFSDKTDQRKQFLDNDDVDYKLSYLNDAQRQVIMDQLKGFRVDEIALKQGLSADQVRGRLFRAKSKLKRIFRLK